jgi:hypothetical protein
MPNNSYTNMLQGADRGSQIMGALGNLTNSIGNAYQGYSSGNDERDLVEFFTTKQATPENIQLFAAKHPQMPLQDIYTKSSVIGRQRQMVAAKNLFADLQARDAAGETIDETTLPEIMKKHPDVDGNTAMDMINKMQQQGINFMKMSEAKRESTRSKNFDEGMKSLTTETVPEVLSIGGKKLSPAQDPYGLSAGTDLSMERPTGKMISRSKTPSTDDFYKLVMRTGSKEDIIAVMKAYKDSDAAERLAIYRNWNDFTNDSKKVFAITGKPSDLENVVKEKTSKLLTPEEFAQQRALRVAGRSPGSGKDPMVRITMPDGKQLTVPNSELDWYIKEKKAVEGWNEKKGKGGRQLVTPPGTGGYKWENGKLVPN